MSQHPSEHPGPDGQNEVSQAALPPAGVEIATPVSRGQVLRVMALLTVAFLVGALLLRVQADRIRPLDLPLPAGWEAVSADTVLAGISPQSAVRAARTADAPVGASPRVRLITLTTAGSDAPSLSGVYWLIVTDDVRPSMATQIQRFHRTDRGAPHQQRPRRAVSALAVRASVHQRAPTAS
jgi:hypothetical protein